MWVKETGDRVTRSVYKIVLVVLVAVGVCVCICIAAALMLLRVSVLVPVPVLVLSTLKRLLRDSNTSILYVSTAAAV